MWKSIKKGLSLIGQSLGVVILVTLAFMVFCIMMPASTGWAAFLWGLGGFILLFAAFVGVWAIGEENKK
jgi:hypothetical protein